MKKCPSCGYEGEEHNCPTCQEPLESLCENCDATEADCVCVEGAEEKEEE